MRMLNILKKCTTVKYCQGHFILKFQNAYDLTVELFNVFSLEALFMCVF